jgi:polyisoprenoid-binding protein YceI
VTTITRTTPTSCATFAVATFTMTSHEAMAASSKPRRTGGKPRPGRETAMHDNRRAQTAHARRTPCELPPVFDLISRKENVMSASAIASLELFSTADTWQIDPERSSIGFRVKQRLIESVRGRFHDFDGTIQPGSAATFLGTIRVASLATDHARRDEHLRSADFFDAEQFPLMQFASTNVALGDNGSVSVTGELTVKDITRTITLEGTFAGTSIDVDGKERIGFDLRGDLNRLDFDLSWNRLLEAGSLFVGNEVELTLDIVAERAELEKAA